MEKPKRLKEDIFDEETFMFTLQIKPTLFKKFKSNQMSKEYYEDMKQKFVQSGVISNSFWWIINYYVWFILKIGSLNNETYYDDSKVNFKFNFATRIEFNNSKYLKFIDVRQNVIEVKCVGACKISTNFVNLFYTSTENDSVFTYKYEKTTEYISAMIGLLVVGNINTISKITIINDYSNNKIEIFKSNDFKKEQLNRKEFDTIVGPSEYCHYSYNNKDYWVFGEEHVKKIDISKTLSIDYDQSSMRFSTETNNTNSITFDRFLWMLMLQNKKENQEMDCFVELSYYGLKNKKQYNDELDSFMLNNLRKMFSLVNCNQIDPYNRIHYVDYRGYDLDIHTRLTFVGSLQYIASNYSKLSEQFLQLCVYLDNQDWFKRHSNATLLSMRFILDVDFIKQAILQYIPHTDKTYNILMTAIAHFPTMQTKISKSYYKLKNQVDTETFNIIIETITKTLQVPPEDISLKDIFSIKTPTNERIEKITSLQTWEFDIALILRLLRQMKPESKLKVVYVGTFHSHILRRVFLNIGAELVSSNKPFERLEDEHDPDHVPVYQMKITDSSKFTLLK